MLTNEISACIFIASPLANHIWFYYMYAFICYNLHDWLFRSILDVLYTSNVQSN